jgi:hypothetical protein
LEEKMTGESIEEIKEMTKKALCGRVLSEILREKAKELEKLANWWDDGRASHPASVAEVLRGVNWVLENLEEEMRKLEQKLEWCNCSDPWPVSQCCTHGNCDVYRCNNCGGIIKAVSHGYCELGGCDWRE